MENKLIKRLNYLTVYAIFSSCFLMVFILSSFVQKDNNQNIDQLTVKRINIIGEDGSLRMVLSNESRQHPGRVNGKNLESRDRPSGLLFFNDEGDECGGLVYSGKTEDGVTNSGMSFTMDQYKEDQVVQILNSEYYVDGKQTIRRGIAINDLPTGSDLITRMDKIKEIQNKISTLSKEEQQKVIEEYGNSLSSVQRLFIGKTKNNNAGLYLRGPDGKQKINIYVDENNIPKIEVINENGNAINILETK